MVDTKPESGHHRTNENPVDRIRASYQSMCRSVNGGWSAMAASVSLSKDGLENRIYERKGQSVDVHLAMQMQANSNSTLFAEAVAAESGGVFITLPCTATVDHEEIQTVYMALVDEVGRLAREWREATRDGEVDAKERERLDEIRLAICQKVTQMNELTYAVFCR